MSLSSDTNGATACRDFDMDTSGLLLEFTMPSVPASMFAPPPFKPTFHFMTSFPFYGPASSRLQYLDATLYSLLDVLPMSVKVEHAIDDAFSCVMGINCVVLHVAAAACESGLVLEDQSGNPHVMHKPRLHRLMKHAKTELMFFAGANTKLVLDPALAHNIPHIIVQKTADMAPADASTSAFTANFYRRAFTGQPVVDVSPVAVVLYSYAPYCEPYLQAFHAAQAATACYDHVLISKPDAPAVFTFLEHANKVAAACPPSISRVTCPTNVVEGTAASIIMDMDTAAICQRACYGLFSRDQPSRSRLQSVPGMYGALGVEVAAHICQQALNRTHGIEQGFSPGFPGGVLYTDISGFEPCDDQLYAHLSLQLINTAVFDMFRRKATLLVISGCERHPVEWLQPLLLRFLGEAGAVTLCTVGTTARV